MALFRLHNSGPARACPARPWLVDARAAEYDFLQWAICAKTAGIYLRSGSRSGQSDDSYPLGFRAVAPLCRRRCRDRSYPFIVFREFRWGRVAASRGERPVGHRTRPARLGTVGQPHANQRLHECGVRVCWPTLLGGTQPSRIEARCIPSNTPFDQGCVEKCGLQQRRPGAALSVSMASGRTTCVRVLNEDFGLTWSAISKSGHGLRPRVKPQGASFGG